MNGLWAPIFDLCARLALFISYILLLRFILHRLCRHTAEVHLFRALAASLTVAGVHGVYTGVLRDPLGPAGIAGALLAAWLVMRKLCWSSWRETLIAGSLYAMLVVMCSFGYDKAVDRLLPQRETFLDRWEKSSTTLFYLRRSKEDAISWEWLFARMLEPAGQPDRPARPATIQPVAAVAAGTARMPPRAQGALAVPALPAASSPAPGTRPVQPVSPPVVAAAPAVAVNPAPPTAAKPAVQRVAMPLDGFVSPALYPDAHPSYRLLKMKGRISASGGRQAVLCNGRVVTVGASVTVDFEGGAYDWRLESIGERHAVWSRSDGSADDTLTW